MSATSISAFTLSRKYSTAFAATSAAFIWNPNGVLSSTAGTGGGPRGGRRRSADDPTPGLGALEGRGWFPAGGCARRTLQIELRSPDAGHGAVDELRLPSVVPPEADPQLVEVGDVVPDPLVPVG